MGIIGGQIGYEILRFIAPRYNNSSNNTEETPEQLDTKLERSFGAKLFALIENKVVIDFGCGTGNYSVEMAERGGHQR